MLRVWKFESVVSDVDPFDSDMVSAIAEASGTTYVRNRWVYNLDNSGELQHVIVAPSLPGSGNYSAYNDWGTIRNEIKSYL